MLTGPVSSLFQPPQPTLVPILPAGMRIYDSFITAWHHVCLPPPANAGPSMKFRVQQSQTTRRHLCSACLQGVPLPHPSRLSFPCPLSSEVNANAVLRGPISRDGLGPCRQCARPCWARLPPSPPLGNPLRVGDHSSANLSIHHCEHATSKLMARSVHARSMMWPRRRYHRHRGHAKLAALGFLMLLLRFGSGGNLTMDTTIKVPPRRQAVGSDTLPAWWGDKP